MSSSSISNSSTNYINYLPKDMIVYEIFKHLSIKDVFKNLSMTCKNYTEYAKFYFESIADAWKIKEDNEEKRNSKIKEIYKNIFNSHGHMNVTSAAKLLLEKETISVANALAKKPENEKFSTFKEAREWLHTNQIYLTQLTSIPKELGNLTQLESLHLENKQLTSIPSELENFTLSSPNQLTYLPPEIENLTQLRVLEMGDLPELPKLLLGNNQLKDQVLFEAMKNQTTTFAQYFIENGNPNLNALDSNGNTILHLVAMNKQSKFAIMLIEKGGSDLLKIQNNQGDTPLHLAINKKPSNFSTQPNNNAQNINEETALQDNDFARLLIKRSDSSLLNIQNSQGNTPLHLALKNKNNDLIRPLIENSDSKLLDAQDNYNETVLHLALKMQIDNDLIKLLIEKSDSKQLNAQQTQGETALYWAVNNNVDEAIIMLLIEKMDSEHLNTQKRNGETVLHAAICRNKENIIDRLLKECDLELLKIQDKKGRTPLMLSNEMFPNSQKDIRRALREKSSQNANS